MSIGPAVGWARRFGRWVLPVLLALPVGAAANQLAGHASPYLALHGDDPVEWRDWNAGAVEAARRDDRLLLLSVGYFACHWCHVMQRESFQDAGIAALLNRHFVPVKIDRELEPSLDDRLVRFAEQTLGQAGWPLNVFVTPEGYPLAATLYMPPAAFRELAERVEALWSQDRERLRELAARAAGGEPPPPAGQLDAARAGYLESVFVQQALIFHDDFQGGFSNQSKFPHAPELDYLVELQQRAPRPAVEAMLRLTLDAMADEGLMDHVGGGFFRYTVDPGWATPHFEKMLYDNAQLARVYLEAGRVLDQPRYLEVAMRTLDFMRREMASVDGAMVASLSAVDAAGVEGGYYLWRDQELEALFDPETLRIVRARCDIAGAPVLPAGHHLRCSRTLQHVARNLGIDVAEAEQRASGALEILRRAREDRSLPVDGKLLAGWNGLALSAFSEAYQALGDAEYLADARRIRNYLVDRLWDGESMARAVGADGAPIGTPSLEDYVYAAEGLWRYAAVSGSDDAVIARRLVELAWERFRHGNGWVTASRSLLAPPPPVEFVTDSPLPSPTALLILLSLEISGSDDSDLRRLALAAGNRGFAELEDNAFFLAGHVRALVRLTKGSQPIPGDGG